MSLAPAASPDRQAIILQHYPMVRSIARRIHHRVPRNVDVDDLISAGLTGLIEAIDRYEPSRAVPFELYARHRIQGAVVDALRGEDWVPRSVRRKADLLQHHRGRLTESLGRDPTREEMAQAVEVPVKKLENMQRDATVRSLVSLDAPVDDDAQTLRVDRVADDVADVLDRWQTRQLQQITTDAVRLLPDRERKAVALYYLHGLQLKEVGHVLGVTESRASQLCSEGVARLRFRLRSHLS